MAFQSNDYLNWYMPRLRRGDGAINLHSSGVEALDFQLVEPAKGDLWEIVGRFEADLAAWLGIPSQEVCFAPGATGNICTEDLVSMAHEMGLATGLDLDALIALSRRLPDLVGHEVPGQVAKAGRPCELHAPPLKAA